MPGVSSGSLMAAANLACSHEGQQLLSTMGACEAILAILSTDPCKNDPAVNASGLLAVGNLAVNHGGKLRLLNNNAVQVVVAALRNERFSKACRVHDQGLTALSVCAPYHTQAVVALHFFWNHHYVCFVRTHSIYSGLRWT